MNLTNNQGSSKCKVVVDSLGHHLWGREPSAEIGDGNGNSGNVWIPSGFSFRGTLRAYMRLICSSH
jgi:hypothetical protein